MGYSHEYFRQEVTSENSNYDNTIYKYLLDFEMDNYPINIKEKNLNENIGNIELIDVADNLTKDSVKMAILSDSRLPNILQMSRLNEAGSRNANRIGKEAVKKIYDECISRGYIEKDQSINYRELHTKTKADNNFSELYTGSVELHPKTFIVANKNKNVVAYEHEMEMVDTRDVIDKPHFYAERFREII